MRQRKDQMVGEHGEGADAEKAHDLQDHSAKTPLHPGRPKYQRVQETIFLLGISRC